MARDLDSDCNWRERPAIDDRIQSNIGFRALADADNRNIPITAGARGGMKRARLHCPACGAEVERGGAVSRSRMPPRLARVALVAIRAVAQS
jgi:hypothetical protein